MNWAYDDEAMKPMPRLGPPRPWWHTWMMLAVLAASTAVVPLVAWLFW